MPIIESALAAALVFGLLALIAATSRRIGKGSRGAAFLLTVAAAGLGLLVSSLMQLSAISVLWHPVTLALAGLGSLALLLRRSRARGSLF